MPDAIIFDFDGVIVDSEPLHWRAFQMVLAPLGFCLSWEDYLGGYVGLDDRGAFRKAFHANRRPLDDSMLAELIRKKAEAFQREVAKGVDPFPGVIDLILKAVESCPTALCSGALRSDILPVLSSMGLAGLFPVMVSAEEVSVSKPDPESYQLALNRLRTLFPDRLLQSHRCVAIEDTPAGIASARGAGMGVLAVTNNFPAERLEGATRIVDTLEGVTLAVLNEIVTPQQKSETVV